MKERPNILASMSIEMTESEYEKLTSNMKGKKREVIREALRKNKKLLRDSGMNDEEIEEFINSDEDMDDLLREAEQERIETFNESVRMKKENDTLPQFKLRRTKKAMIDKMQSPLWKLEELFIGEQIARNNTEDTIKYYTSCFKMIYNFLLYISSENESSKDKKGSMLPIVFLEMDEIDMHYMEYLQDVKELGEQTILKEFRGYRAIMYYAMDNGWLERRKIKIKDIEPPIKNTYTKEEIERLIAKPDIDNFSKYRSWVMVCFFLATGMRVSSALSLKVSDIDLEEGFVNVNMVKNRSPIRIPLIKSICPKLEEYIREWRSSDLGYPLYDEYLFCNPYGQKLTRDAACKIIAVYNRSRGVEKTSIHLFRHTFAKNWILDNGDTVTLQKMLGQKSLKMVTRYANLYAPDIKPKAEEHALLNKVNPTSGRKKIQRAGTGK